MHASSPISQTLLRERTGNVWGCYYPGFSLLTYIQVCVSMHADNLFVTPLALPLTNELSNNIKKVQMEKTKN